MTGNQEVTLLCNRLKSQASSSYLKWIVTGRQHGCQLVKVMRVAKHAFGSPSFPAFLVPGGGCGGVEASSAQDEWSMS